MILLRRRSPAAGFGFDESGVPLAVTQRTEQKGTLPFEADVDCFLHVDYTIPKREETISLQADVAIMPKQQQLQHKSPLARKLRDHRELAAAKGDRIGCQANHAV